MDEDEIDSWYEDEKQRLLDEYTAEIEEKKNYDEAEKKYSQKMDKLVLKYNRRMEGKISAKKPKGAAKKSSFFRRN